ncbi:10 kDa heat shock protein, mitochondrial-like [Arvicanthis niloticus]|uniref:10 kDa heat shock protein, mitochondrial-like n=1 Tax=Arvicanthis niloticus TaxID=61156 RepID=UPI001485F2FE|nr:10 kDa heat shock protein, mitochondrial-like [Arvicanthis niloticus]
MEKLNATLAVSFTGSYDEGAGQAFRKFLLLFDRVLLERRAAKTVGHPKVGLHFQKVSKKSIVSNSVVGSGTTGKCGEIQAVSVKAGDEVLLPEHGGTKGVLDDKDHFLFRDGNALGKSVD